MKKNERIQKPDIKRRFSNIKKKRNLGVLRFREYTTIRKGIV